MSYVSATVEVVTEADVEIDVDDIIDQISDETIREQYHERNLGGGSETWDEDNEETELNKAYLAHHNGDKDKAYEILWELCLERLNKVV